MAATELKKPEEMALKDAEANEAGHDAADGEGAAAPRAEVRPDESDGGSRGKMGLLAKIAIVAALAVAVVVTIVLTLTLGGENVCEDDFDEDVYKKDGKEVYIKFKFVEVDEDHTGYNKSSAEQACRDLGAELWEVQGGEEEWETVRKHMDDPNSLWPQFSFWLNAEAVENCEAGAAAICKEDEAREGNGLRVRWKASKGTATYSRLVGGTDSDCVFITDKASGRLWKKDRCDKGKVAPCVKRRCAMPERDSPNAQHSSKDE